MEVNVITNEMRAERGWAILQMYALQYGDFDGNSSNLTDVLADFMHLARQHSENPLNFDDCLEMARRHFEAEMEEEHSMN